MFPGSGRVEVAAKSPVTGIQGMSNMGGYWGPELKYAGYDSMVIKGKAAKPVYIGINNDERRNQGCVPHLGHGHLQDPGRYPAGGIG